MTNRVSCDRLNEEQIEKLQAAWNIIMDVWTNRNNPDLGPDEISDHLFEALKSITSALNIDKEIKEDFKIDD